MALSDVERIGIGMQNYAENLKRMGITPRENFLLAYQHKIPRFLPNTFVDAAMLMPAGDIERYMGQTVGEDGFGVEWTYVPLEHAPMPTPGKFVLEDITQWRDTVKFPNLDAYDWKRQAELDMHGDIVALMATGEYTPLPDGKDVLEGGKACIAVVINGMFERLHALMGFENALVSLVTEPEASFELFSAIADHKIRLFKKIKEYYPVDIINAHDDYGAKSSMFMSLDMWRALLKPNLKRMVDACHEMGLIYQHHSCGYVEPLIPDLIDIGVDALDVLQGGSNHNLKALKAQYGSKLTFVGGCDNVNVFDREGVTAEECKAEYLRVVNELAPGGSFVSYASGLLPFSMIPTTAAHYDVAFSVYKD